MPHQRHKSKGKENSGPKRKDSGNTAPAVQEQNEGLGAVAAVGGQEQGAVGGVDPQDEVRAVKCCVPPGCEMIKDLINPSEPADAVKVACNNENCNQSPWMHLDCFNIWEESVLSFLRSCGRARSWSEKQRLQNLWTKKGYDLAYKACDCICGRGHLRKDLDYFPKPMPAVQKKKTKKGNVLPTLTVSSKGHHTAAQNVNHKDNNGNNSSHPAAVSSPSVQPPRERVNSFDNEKFRERVSSSSSNGSSGGVGVQRELQSPRDRSNSIGANTIARPIATLPSSARNRHCSTASMTSTGSSPPNSNESPSSSSPATPSTPIFGRPAGQVNVKKTKFDFTTDHAATGNIFKKRESLNAFQCLPRHKRNPYHIKMEDDGLHGSDDTRNFLMSNLSTYKATNVHCLLCRAPMSVFDRYPLIDGTFFLSPVSYDEVVAFPLEMDNKRLYLHAVCIHCLEGAVRLICQCCNKDWQGSNLQLGTMYSYDIFAASACCDKRITCKKCQAPVISIYQNINYFSEFSRKLQCPRCKNEDYHFVKPLQDVYYAKSICN